VEPSVTVGLKDIVLMVGLFCTAFGIAGAWFNLRRDVKDLKTTVTNDIRSRIEKIEGEVAEVKHRMDHLPCGRTVEVRHHRRDDPSNVDIESIRRARICEGEA
jgi:hypothetical protein